MRILVWPFFNPNFFFYRHCQAQGGWNAPRDEAPPYYTGRTCTVGDRFFTAPAVHRNDAADNLSWVETKQSLCYADQGGGIC